MLAMIIATIVSLVLSGGIYYLFIPAINLTSGGFWFFAISFLGILLLSYAIVWSYSDEYLLPIKILGGIGGAILVVFMVLGLISSSLFQASNYRNAHVVSVSQNESEENLPVVENKDDIPIIDVYTARKLGDRAMGVMEKYLSQYEVSNEYSLIQYKGEFFRISPLEYGGFWKYNNSKATGIPGYVMVNIYTGEAELVELPPEQAIRYAPSAYCGKDMFRHLRTKYPTTIFGDYHFEIDENGTPHYIVATMRSTAGVFGAKVVDGFVVMNAATGEANYYELIAAMPDWIDNVYSVEQLMKQIDWHFEYIHGVFNFSSKDVRKTSYSFDNSQYYLYPDNGEIILYTGVTSAGNDESNIGYVLANMRTGETTYFASPGAEESSAQESAKGLVQQYGYSSGPVMLVSIDGIETYFLTLKDHQGLVKQYALVNKEDYNVVSVAETVEQVVYSYRRKVSGFEAEGDVGTVNTVYTAVIDGNTTYVFTLNGIDATYLSDISVNYEQHYKLMPGQEVQLAYLEQGETRVVTSLGFLVDIREETE